MTASFSRIHASTIGQEFEMNIDQLVEQKIAEYESRLKHIDEMIKKTEDKCVDEHAKFELDEIKTLCAKLNENNDYIDDISKHNWHEKTIEKAGPMALLDSVAQKIEQLAEKLD